LSNTHHIFPLPRNVPIIIGRQEFVVEYAAGKRVLHLGCVDEGLTEKKHQEGLLLHERLHKNTRELWGVDVDIEGLRWMQERGYPHLYQADIEELHTVTELKGQNFDLILLSEVMEHLDNPGRFLQGAHFLFGPDTELLITVPNATSLANWMTNWQAKELVHPDHNYWFSLHTLTALLGKFRYQVTFTAVYSQYNFRRSIGGYLVRRLLGRKDGGQSAQASDDQPEATSAEERTVKYRIPNIAGWLQAVRITLMYRRYLGRNPFFADGLIVIAKSENPRES
jgi:2-polyprenyl-3-methyl-5-hydroxy-6-metoxy-1,4-benzoquinol methylase